MLLLDMDYLMKFRTRIDHTMCQCCLDDPCPLPGMHETTADDERVTLVILNNPLAILTGDISDAVYIRVCETCEGTGFVAGFCMN